MFVGVCAAIVVGRVEVDLVTERAFEAMLEVPALAKWYLKRLERERKQGDKDVERKRKLFEMFERRYPDLLDR